VTSHLYLIYLLHHLYKIRFSVKLQDGYVLIQGLQAVINEKSNGKQICNSLIWFGSLGARDQGPKFRDK
jgi:hypothetical protein